MSKFHSNSNSKRFNNTKWKPHYSELVRAQGSLIIFFIRSNAPKLSFLQFFLNGKTCFVPKYRCEFQFKVHLLKILLKSSEQVQATVQNYT